MRYVTAGALLLVIIGAVKFGETNRISSIIYSLVGIAGLGLIPHIIRQLNGADETW